MQCDKSQYHFLSKSINVGANHLLDDLHRHGQSPQPLGDFCKFFEKKNYLNAIGSHFARVQSHFNELDF